MGDLNLQILDGVGVLVQVQSNHNWDISKRSATVQELIEESAVKSLLFRPAGKPQPEKKWNAFLALP